ncbi:Protein PTHB1 [Trichinella pseudospiralis]|uniref:Protein PTHB1 n=1 Tax=Trichinella pseudospiralis TaxID=6337 RepID=A0A0V1JN58_TRIPS|nr:Protein PTHB1 [Trichinella pseudospiralis]
MSLFQTKELWQCKLSDAADLSFMCLSVANLTGKSDQIIIGTSNGFLHIYEPCIKQEEISSLNPTDSHNGLLLKLSFFVSDVVLLYNGLFSNTSKLQLCILHQKSVAVYSLQERLNKTFLHGKDYHLEILYEYPLSHNAYNMISGSLNGHDDSNFICVQSLDGVLYIFEQEMNVFSHYLPDFLLPGPLCFSNEVNLFLTVSSTWEVQTFKYEKILLNANRLSAAENKADEKKRLLIPEWQYLLGERAVEVVAVEDPAALFSFIILGEQNLFCLSCNGALVTMKRLDYAPLCLHFYGMTQDSKVRYITTTDDGTMLFYNDTTLRWAAKLPFVPLNLALGRIRGINGVIVTLSSTGSIHCVYLGTDPMIQQIKLKWHSTETYEKRLEVYKEMTHKIKRLKMKDGKVSNIIESKIQQKELNVDILIMNKFHKEYKSLIQFGAEEEPEPAFLIKVTTDTVKSLENQYLLFRSSDAVKIVPQLVHVPTAEKTCVQYFKVFPVVGAIPVDSNIILEIYYNAENGEQKLWKENVDLPLLTFYDRCLTKKVARHKITFEINKPIVPLDKLFHELTGRGSTDENNAIGLRQIYGQGTPTFILASKSSTKYRIQSESLESLWFPTNEIIKRLRRIYSSDDFEIKLTSDIPLKEYFSIVENFVQLTEKRSAKRTLITKKAVQVRIVQRQFFIKLKDVHSGSLADLHQVLQQMNKEIIHLLEEHSKINALLKAALNALRAGNHLISTLICYSYNLKGRETESVTKVLEISPDDAFGENWLPNVIAGLEVLQHSLDDQKNVTFSAYEETSANEYLLFEQLLTSLVKKLQSGEKLTLYKDSPANLKQSN